MKRLLNAFTALYVCFAILIAHSAVASTKATIQRNVGQGIVVVAPEQVVQTNSRLYDTDTPRTTKAAYQVVIWTADWCGPCQVYKRVEVPALVKIGYTVTVKNYDRDGQPKSVKVVPTVMLYYKGVLIQTKPYWRARDLDKYVDNRMSLKG